MATVVGSNKAFFLKTDAAKTPETFTSGSPVTWNRDGKAIQVSAISATVTNNKFNMNTFEPESTAGLEKFWWSVVSGNWAQGVRP